MGFKVKRGATFRRVQRERRVRKIKREREARRIKREARRYKIVKGKFVEVDREGREVIRLKPQKPKPPTREELAKIRGPAAYVAVKTDPLTGKVVSRERVEVTPEGKRIVTPVTSRVGLSTGGRVAAVKAEKKVRIAREMLGLTPEGKFSRIKKTLTPREKISRIYPIQYIPPHLKKGAIKTKLAQYKKELGEVRSRIQEEKTRTKKLAAKRQFAVIGLEKALGVTGRVRQPLTTKEVELESKILETQIMLDLENLKEKTRKEKEKFEARWKPLIKEEGKEKVFIGTSERYAQFLYDVKNLEKSAEARAQAYETKVKKELKTFEEKMIERFGVLEPGWRTKTLTLKGKELKLGEPMITPTTLYPEIEERFFIEKTPMFEEQMRKMRGVILTPKETKKMEEAQKKAVEKSFAFTPERVVPEIAAGAGFGGAVGAIGGFAGVATGAVVGATATLVGETARSITYGVTGFAEEQLTNMGVSEKKAREIIYLAVPKYFFRPQELATEAYEISKRKEPLGRVLAEKAFQSSQANIAFLRGQMEYEEFGRAKGFVRLTREETAEVAGILGFFGGAEVGVRTTGEAARRITKNIAAISSNIRAGVQVRTIKYGGVETPVLTRGKKAVIFVSDIHRNPFLGDRPLEDLKRISKAGTGVPVLGAKAFPRVGPVKEILRKGEKALITMSPEYHWRIPLKGQWYEAIAPAKKMLPKTLRKFEDVYLVSRQFGAPGFAGRTSIDYEKLRLVLRPTETVVTLSKMPVGELQLSGEKSAVNVVKEFTRPKYAGQRMISPENIAFEKAARPIREAQYSIQAQGFRPDMTEVGGSILNVEKAFGKVAFYDKFPLKLPSIIQKYPKISRGVKLFWEKSGLGREWKSARLFGVTYSVPIEKPPVQPTIGERPTVKGIYYKKGKFLLVEERLGQLGFPGGGVEPYLDPQYYARSKTYVPGGRWVLAKEKPTLGRELIEELGVSPLRKKKLPFEAMGEVYKSSKGFSQKDVARFYELKFFPRRPRVPLKALKSGEIKRLVRMTPEELFVSEKVTKETKIGAAKYLEYLDKRAVRVKIPKQSMSSRFMESFQKVTKRKVGKLDIKRGKKFPSISAYDIRPFREVTIGDITKAMRYGVYGRKGFSPMTGEYTARFVEKFKPISYKLPKRELVSYKRLGRKPVPVTKEHKIPVPKFFRTPVYETFGYRQPGKVYYKKPAYKPLETVSYKRSIYTAPGILVKPSKVVAKPVPSEKRKTFVEKSKGGTYHAFVRRDTTKGKKPKWKKVTEKPLPYNLAWNTGIRVADVTIGRSVTVKKVSKKTPRFPDDPFKNLGKFRKKAKRSKISTEPVYIEKSKYAIDTPGEVRGLKIGKYLAEQKAAKRGGILGF